MISTQRVHVRSCGNGLLTPKKTNVPKPILLIIVGVTCPTAHNPVSHFPHYTSERRKGLPMKLFIQLDEAAIDTPLPRTDNGQISAARIQPHGPHE